MSAPASGRLRLLALVAMSALVAGCVGADSGGDFCDGTLDLDLWVVAGDGEAARLTDSDGADGFPDWSPDGTRIAFASGRDGNCEIYLMDADGSGVVNLTRSESDELYPSWSPDGTQIVFASTEAGGAELFIVDVDTRERRQVSASGLIHNYPDWSPDGEMIVFSGGTQPAGPETIHDLYVMPSSGGVPTQLTFQTDLLSAPRWSPDGSQIAYVSHDGPLAVWVMGADGRGGHEVTAGGLLAWGPDGETIVFDREVEDGDVDIFSTDSGGATETVVVDGVGIDAMPSWSPDGTSLVFASDRQRDSDEDS